LIISGGENIYPAEVESALLAHPAVAEAGVFGVPDAQWGHRVIAAVVFHPGMAAEVESLIMFCAERLARYKVPGQILPVLSLPRNAAGKLLRRTLREMWPGT
jgi:O-succinylbenzoic acid--CoA ligase